jgi:hypothetical protein
MTSPHSRAWIAIVFAGFIGASNLGCDASEPAPSTPEQIEKSRQEHVQRSNREMQETGSTAPRK